MAALRMCPRGGRSVFHVALQLRVTHRHGWSPLLQFIFSRLDRCSCAYGAVLFRWSSTCSGNLALFREKPTKQSPLSIVLTIMTYHGKNNTNGQPTGTVRSILTGHAHVTGTIATDDNRKQTASPPAIKYISLPHFYFRISDSFLSSAHPPASDCPAPSLHASIPRATVRSTRPKPRRRHKPESHQQGILSRSTGYPYQTWQATEQPCSPPTPRSKSASTAPHSLLSPSSSTP